MSSTRKTNKQANNNNNTYSFSLFLQHALSSCTFFYFFSLFSHTSHESDSHGFVGCRHCTCSRCDPLIVFCDSLPVRRKHKKQHKWRVFVFFSSDSFLCRTRTKLKMNAHRDVASSAVLLLLDLAVRSDKGAARAARSHGRTPTVAAASSSGGRAEVDAFLVRLHARATAVGGADADDDGDGGGGGSSFTSDSSASGAVTSSSSSSSSSSDGESAPVKRRRRRLRGRGGDSSATGAAAGGAPTTMRSVANITVTPSQAAFACDLGKHFSFHQSLGGSSSAVAAERASSPSRPAVVIATGGAFWSAPAVQRAAARRVVGLARRRLASCDGSAAATATTSQSHLVVFHGCDACPVHHTHTREEQAPPPPPAASYSAPSCPPQCRSRVFDESVHEALRRIFSEYGSGGASSARQWKRGDSDTDSDSGSEASTASSSTRRDDGSDRFVFADSSISVACAAIGARVGVKAATARDAVAVDLIMRTMRDEEAAARAFDDRRGGRRDGTKNGGGRGAERRGRGGGGAVAHDSSSSATDTASDGSSSDCEDEDGAEQRPPHHNHQRRSSNAARTDRVITRAGHAVHLAVSSLHDASAYLDACHTRFRKMCRKPAMLLGDDASFEPWHFVFIVCMRRRGTTIAHTVNFVELASHASQRQALRVDIANTQVMLRALVRAKVAAGAGAAVAGGVCGGPSSKPALFFCEATEAAFGAASRGCVVGLFLGAPTQDQSARAAAVAMQISQQQAAAPAPAPLSSPPMQHAAHRHLHANPDARGADVFMSPFRQQQQRHDTASVLSDVAGSSRGPQRPRSATGDNNNNNNNNNSPVAGCGGAIDCWSALTLVGMADGHCDERGTNHDRLLMTCRFGDFAAEIAAAAAAAAAPSASAVKGTRQSSPPSSSAAVAVDVSRRAAATAATTKPSQVKSSSLAAVETVAASVVQPTQARVRDATPGVVAAAASTAARPVPTARTTQSGATSTAATATTAAFNATTTMTAASFAGVVGVGVKATGPGAAASTWRQQTDKRTTTATTTTATTTVSRSFASSSTVVVSPFVLRRSVPSELPVALQLQKEPEMRSGHDDDGDGDDSVITTTDDDVDVDDSSYSCTTEDTPTTDHARRHGASPPATAASPPAPPPLRAAIERNNTNNTCESSPRPTVAAAAVAAAARSSSPWQHDRSDRVPVVANAAQETSVMRAGRSQSAVTESAWRPDVWVEIAKQARRVLSVYRDEAPIRFGRVQ